MQKDCINLVLELDNLPPISILSIYLSVSSVLWHKCQGDSPPAAIHQFMHRMLGDLTVFSDCLILITMNRWTEGTVCTGRPDKISNPIHSGIKNWTMYAIKQIKICVEYRDMLPRLWLDLSGTPGLQPICLSPGSRQTSLGLGSISQYPAQILNCIVTRLCIQQVVLAHKWNAKAN